MPKEPKSWPADLALVRSAMGGDSDAIAQLIRDISDVVWSICRRLNRNEGAARETFTSVIAGLQANGFARLRPYDGRSRLETFVVLVVRELLVERMLALLDDNAHQAWSAFESLCRDSVEGVIRRRLPGPRNEELRRDAYQEICLGLVANNYRCLRGYSGTGSFGGYILRTVDRLTVDFIRRFVARRLRLPAAIAQLSRPAREVFRLVYWEKAGDDSAALAKGLAQRLQPPPTPADIAAVLGEIRRVLPANYVAPSGMGFEVSEPSDDEIENVPAETTPEDIAIEDEARRKLNGAIAALPEPEQTYIRIKLRDDLPPREIAKVMGLPVADVYKLAQRAEVLLKKHFSSAHPAKTQPASV